ncbi:G2/mitotic-specific cyclin-A-like [Haliotis rufescens]|uniref:G2/mitotic-specific cyclin-A-like n=1 Tax=Haliotis rufescens TaxID=6454 RepID=UPI001EB0A70A|nr:G2/mitotic-specific cyclin-A-like [Haliotis rufescens]
MSLLQQTRTNFGDENAEGTRKTKGLSVKSSNQAAPKRTALGTITNQVRKQPSRAAKGSNYSTGQDENGFARQKPFADSTQGFSIFVDEEPTLQALKPVSVCHSTDSNTSGIKLSDAVTSLSDVSSTLTSLQDNAIHVDEIDSPMVLDTTLDESSVSKPLDREAVILTVPEYAEDIYNYLREAELRNRPKPGYMKKQPDITNSMRSILVDWLVEVAEEYKLHRETLFLAVNYIDRFLSHMSVNRGKLQLVGAASMFLAGKYEEIYPPDVAEFVYITDDTYTAQQVLRMEHLVLKVLSFDVAVPTTNWFCDRFLKISNADSKTEHLTMYLAELTLVECEPYLKYCPSQLAATALCLANYTLGKESWPSSLESQTRYSLTQLAETLKHLYRTFCNATSHPQQAIREKYRAPKYHQVSLLSPPETLSLVP